METSKKIIYMDGFDDIRDFETQSIILFKTNEFYVSPNNIEEFCDDIVNIWNNSEDVDSNFGPDGVLDVYLLNSPLCYQEDRELITEVLSEWGNPIDLI